MHPHRILGLVLVFLCPACLHAAPDTIKAEAPANHVILKHTRGGAYFVARGLKEEYDRLLNRTQALRMDLETGRIAPLEAQRQIDQLDRALAELREQIDRQKVLISPLKLHQQTQTITFDLGPEKRLVITADNVTLLGWDGPQVKCILEKAVIAPPGQSAENDLAALKVIHRHAPAPQLVGNPSPNPGSPPSPYQPFQGKPIDTLEIQGLSAEEGNTQVTVGVSSPNGDSSLGSDWKRYASLTVYIPTCNAVALRGCLVNLKVQDVHTALLVTRDGSRDRDYNGSFTLRDIHGSLTIENAPVDIIDGVDGNLTIHSPLELANTGTHHENDMRMFYTPPPRTLVCRNIEGNLFARFTRADLRIAGVLGQIDIQNDFGATALTSNTPLASLAHRIISQSGPIEVHLGPQARKNLPILALTSCGGVITNAPQTLLDDTSFTLGADPIATGSWQGVRTRPATPQAGFEMFGRISAALQGQARSPGLDLISRAGPVKLLFEP